jgi:hypothetical protein
MNQTGATYETAKSALQTSDGDVDIAIRIIRTYELRDDAAAAGSGTSQQAGQDGQSQDGSQGEQAKNGGEDQPGTDEEIPLAGDILDAIKEIWKNGNASRLDIEKDGSTLLSISLVIGTIGLVLAPVAALIGIGAALITDYKVIITLNNGTVINVNEFAVSHKESAGQ